jgi:hypothetical protein
MDVANEPALESPLERFRSSVQTWRGGMRWIMLCGLMLAAAFPGHAIAQRASASNPSQQSIPRWRPSESLLEQFWIPDEPLEALAADSDTIYLGGRFGLVGPYTGSAPRIELETGAPDATWPKLDGSVFAIADDGSGGFFIGGDFTEVDGVAHRGLVHIGSDGLPASWNLKISKVQALAVSGQTVYLGGQFGDVNGVVRNNLAAIDVSTGALLPWNPGGAASWSSDQSVQALLVHAGAVYIGGYFQAAVGGVARRHFAAVDATTGVAYSLDPNPDGAVFALAERAGHLYVGGNFATFAGAGRNRAGAIDLASGALTVWDPNASATVLALATDVGTVFLAGCSRPWAGRRGITRQPSTLIPCGVAVQSFVERRDRRQHLGRGHRRDR